jgi:hypothetical protein
MVALSMTTLDQPAHEHGIQFFMLSLKKDARRSDGECI